MACLFIFFSFFVFWLCCVARGVLIPRPAIEPALPALGAQSPNHWTTREVPPFHFLNDVFWWTGVLNFDEVQFINLYGYCWVQSKKSLPGSRSWRVSPVLSSFFYKFICLFIYLFIYWLRWVFVAARGLSLVVASGVTLRCSAQASHCGGFSCCGAWALGCRLQ